MSQVMTFDEYSALHGVSRTAPSFPECHRAPGGVSEVASRQYGERILDALQDWQDKRDILRQEYVQAVSAGEIRMPTRIEKLQRTAQGDSEAAQAARRILKKRLHNQEEPNVIIDKGESLEA